MNSSLNNETFTLTPESDFLPGVYYWRVRKEKGAWSEVRQVIINSPISFIQPANGELFMPPNTMVTLSWNALPGVNWEYVLTCSKNANFASPVINQTISQTSFTYTFPTTTTQYYCRVTGDYKMVNYDTTIFSNTLTFTIYNETYEEAHTLDEQQLFNMAQPHLTGDMSFALFDITPTGILTTIQFDDGAVVTGNVLFSVENGLIVITIQDVLGGSVDQQSAFYQDMSALFMTVFTEALPTDFISIKTFSMTDTGLNIAVMRPTQIP